MSVVESYFDPPAALPPVGAPVPLPEQDAQRIEDIDNSHPELVNLASHLKESQLIEIADMCMTDYEADEESRRDWIEMNARWIRLYYQKDKPVNPPWPGSSSESIPILVEGCNQFHSRAYKAFFGRPGFVTAVPIGHVTQAEVDRAERVARYMSWQLEVKDRSYKRNKDRLLRALPLHGSFFTKVYRDPVKHRNVVENVRPLDLVVPYGHTAIDIEDAERKTQIIWKPKFVCDGLTKTGYFASECLSFGSDNKNAAEKALDEAQGIKEPDNQRHFPCKILEQHRYLDLNEDGIHEPYIVWLDAKSRQVLRITIRYNVDAFGESVANKDPIEFFTHFSYIENPDGFYGLGQGHLTGDTNVSVNKMLRQAIDAATLQNIRTVLATKNVGIPKGRQEIEYGKIMVVDGMMDDIRKGIFELEFPGPSPGLINLMQALITRADRLNMVTESLTGQTDKVYQPTTMMAQIEQGLTLFSSVQVRVHESIISELKKLYRLNGIYASDVEYFAINDAYGIKQGLVARDDFSEDLQITPAVDLSSGTEGGKIQKAMSVYQLGLENPLIMGSPAHMREITKRVLHAIGEYDIDSILPDVATIEQIQGSSSQAEEAAMQAESAVKEKELDIKQQDVDVKRMKAQAAIQDAQMAAKIKAFEAEQKDKLNRHKYAKSLEDSEAERKIASDTVEAKNIKTAADFESKITALRNSSTGNGGRDDDR